MKYEKSCGAVIWRNNDREREYLIILNKKGNALGHWGFPKGHVEAGEKELDTARREIREEVGLEVDSFMPEFRIVNRYNPRPGSGKGRRVFYCRSADGDIHIQACRGCRLCLAQLLRRTKQNYS